MKVILVNMPWKCKGIWGIRAGSRWPHLKHPDSEKDYTPYPFFLGYATSLLKKNNIDAELIDAIAERIEVPDFLSLLEHKKPDLIVAETSTPSLQHDLSLIQRMREISEVALCGPEYNIRNLSFLKEKNYIDFVMIGEYEETLLELIQNLENKKNLSEIKGIIYRKNNRLYKNPLRPLIKDLDSLPWPYREGLFMENYIDAPGGMPLPSAQMWTSRGCPYSCIFCLWPQIMYHGNSYRFRNPYKVVDEMEYLIKDLKFKSIYIDDDTTNVNKKFLTQVANEIKKRKLKFPWAIMARPDLMDKELLKVLRSSGLYAVKYGVESADQQILNNANKNMNLEKSIEMIKFTHKLGIKTHLTFTFGLPGETRETIRKTINLALQLNPYSAQFSITTPFPGTLYFEQLKQKGWKEPEDWSLFDGHRKALFNLEKINAKELEDLLNEAYSSWLSYKNQIFAKKNIFQEIKAFWNFTRLYGIKLALEKTNTYLGVKNQLISEQSRSGKYQPICQKKELLKGILSSTHAYTGPKIAVLDITNKCNLTCIGCWLYSPYLNNKDLSELNLQLDTSIIKNTIDEFQKLNLEEIQISGGGEPLLHPDFFEILNYIKSKGIRCQLVTNFTLFDRKKLDAVIKLGLDSITVSLWAGDPETYLRVHPGADKQVFKKITENLKYLIRNRKNEQPLVKIYNVILNQNYKNIPQMLDFALNLGADYLEFQLLDPIPDKTEHLLINKEEALEIEKMLIKFRERADYVSDFISDEELLIFEDPRHRRELSDFGRFIKQNNWNFKLINGIRMAKCPQGYFSIKKVAFPPKDVRHIKYYYDQKTCKNCQLYRVCYKDDKKTPFKVDLLTILGIGTFLRRIRLIAQEKKYLDGEFLNSLPCYAGWYFSRITTDGNVKPCCKAENLILGNINRKSFSEIWFSPAYDKFRQEALSKAKNGSFFKDINCYKVCDNLGMNLLNHKFVLENIKPQKPYSTKVFYYKERVVIPATNFIYGNLNNKGTTFGEGLVIDRGDGFGYAKYEFYLKHAGNYELWTRYATEIPRSVEIKIDGNSFGKIARFTTGGWYSRHLKFFKEFEVKLNQGKHILEIFSPSYIPHLERIELRLKSKIKKQEHFCDPLNIYKKREPLRLFKEALQTHGLKPTLKRTLNYFKQGKFWDNYLDIIGIFHGKFAYKGPFHVQIDLTNECNNNCIGCWCNSPLLEEKKMPYSVRKQYLPLGLIKEVLTEIKNIGGREIYYSGGGEPFIHPEIMQILEFTKKLDFSCYVNTNFTLLDKEKINQIINYNIDHLTVSIWAGKPQTYAKTHPNKTEETFYKIKENLIYLNKNKLQKPYIKLYQVIFNFNYREIKEMIDFAYETGCESLEFTLIDTIPEKTDKLALNNHQRKELFNLCSEIKKELSSDFKYKGVYLFRYDQFLRRISDDKNVSEAKYDKDIIDSIPCYIGWLFARILPDGNFNSCLKSHRFPVGNLFEQSFSEIWNSSRQIYFREKTLCYRKKDPFFKLIGNDPTTTEAGCYKSCDDIGRNLHIHKKIMSLTALEVGLLKLIAGYKRYKDKKSKPILLYSKPLPKLDDKIILGIINGRKAYQGPEHLVIDLTNRCQLRCIACWLYSPYLRKSKPSSHWLNREIPLERAKDLVRELALMGTKIIRFTGGGEPLLYKGILDLIEIVKSNNIRACLTTNLFSINKDFLKQLLKLKINEMAVSLWAGDARTYTELHPGTTENDFIKIEENLRYFNSLKDKTTKVTLANVISNKNYSKIFQMAELAQKVKADAVYFTLVDIIPDETDILLLNPNQYIELEQEIKKIEPYLKESGIEIENLDGFKKRIQSKTNSGFYDRKRIDKVPCYVGWFFSRIMADGTVVPCCRGVNYPLGNINENSFQEIWYSLKYNGFRARAKYLKKDHPYFWKMNCYKECDNLIHNEEMEKRINYEGISKLYNDSNSFRM